MGRGDRVAARFSYADAVTEAKFRMAYCSEEGAWGVAPHPSTGEEGADDPCSYSVLSQSTTSFDVTTTGEIPWRVYNRRDDSIVNTKSFRMKCVDCDDSSCNPERGVCRDNMCECKDGRYGVHCQFEAPCEELVLDAAKGNFPPIASLVNEATVVLDSSYSVLRDKNGTMAQAYHRPVYVSPGIKYVMMFTGRRWVIISPKLALEGISADLSEEEIENLLLGFFRYDHMYDALMNPLLQQFVVSEAVEIGSPIDQGTPIGLHWTGMRAVKSANRQVLTLDRVKSYDSIFICRFCNNDFNACDHFGTCNNVTKTCECINGTVGFPVYTGALCEKELTCTDVKRDWSGFLPTGCVGDYSCRSDGVCDCVELVGPESGNFCQFLPCYDKSVQAMYPGGCANNGTCSNRTGSCICEDGMFEGKYCQDRVPACYEEPAQLLYPPGGCANDGICNNSTGFCACDEDRFEGRYCQRVLAGCNESSTRLAYPGGCDNNGVCNNSTGACICPGGEIFGGRYCQRTIAACFEPAVQAVYPGGCANNGTCSNSSGFCVCGDGMPEGKNCQTPLAACNRSSVQELYPGGCANNGTCSNVTGSCSCASDMFAGKYCQIRIGA